MRNCELRLTLFGPKLDAEIAVLVLDLYETARSSGHNCVECQGNAQGMSEPFLTGDLQEAPPLTDAKLPTI